MKKNLIIALLTMLLGTFLSGCSSRSSVPGESFSAPPSDAPVYRLQHSGVLDIGGRRFPLRGMLRFQPETRQVRVLMTNEMGMKLLIADIRATEGQQYESAPIFVSPFLRAIPFFYDESIQCIYEMYLADKDSKRPLVTAENGQKRIGDRNFYQHTLIRNSARNYTLELFLNSASQTGS